MLQRRKKLFLSLLATVLVFAGFVVSGCHDEDGPLVSIL
jgi:hypothetical protein